MSRTQRIPALDGLRGLAVLLVLFSHAANVGIRPHPAFDLSGCGRAGVFLFFVLSAFLLTDQLLGAERLAAPATWGRYLVRRLLRVYPAYVAWLFVYFALRERVPTEWTRPWTLEDVGQHLLLVRGDRHLWTIPVELRWYLALPLVIAVAAGLGRRVLPTALVLVLAGVALRLWFPPDYPIALGPYAPVFLVGSLAAVLQRGWRELDDEVRRRGGLVADLVALAAGVTLVLHVPAVWSAVGGARVPHDHFHLAFDRFAALWGLLLLGLLWGRGWLRRPLETRVARFVGAVSYSAYLGHVLVLVLAEKYLRSWPVGSTFLAFVLGTLLVGWASHLALERPFARLWARPAGAPLAGPRDRG